jgi:enolase
VALARSGDTEDAWLTDLAVGGARPDKGRLHARFERTAKWNRLLQLEATEQSTFAGLWPGGHPWEETL